MTEAYEAAEKKIAHMRHLLSHATCLLGEATGLLEGTVLHVENAISREYLKNSVFDGFQRKIDRLINGIVNLDN